MYLNKGSKFICDRSGKAGYMKDAVLETGTNFLVLKSEVDKYPYDAVNHPQANLAKYSPKFDDPKPIKDAHPDISWAAAQVFQGACETGACIQVYAAGVVV